MQNVLVWLIESPINKYCSNKEFWNIKSGDNWGEVYLIFNLGIIRTVKALRLNFTAKCNVWLQTEIPNNHVLSF